MTGAIERTGCRARSAPVDRWRMNRPRKSRTVLETGTWRRCSHRSHFRGLVGGIRIIEIAYLR